MTTYANRLVTTVSAVASAGAGAFTVSTASSGYRTFVAGDDGKTFDVTIVEGTAWEVRTGCVYTHSVTSLARGTLEASSTGSAIAFNTSGTNVILTVTPTAAMFDALERTMAGVIPGGRLTLESGVPVSTTDQTAKTTIYYTPYVHNVISLWDGVDWVPTTFAETSEALGTLTSGLPYDVFGFLSSGVLDLEKLAWTSGTARATAVTLQDGRYCKSGDKTRLLLGTFYTASTTTTEDSVGSRFLCNVYNQVSRGLYKVDQTQHTYASATERDWRGSGTSTYAAWVQATGGTPTNIVFYARMQANNSSGHCTASAYVNGSNLPQILQNYLLVGLVAGSATTEFISRAGLNSVILRQTSFSGTDSTFYEGAINGGVQA